MSDSVNLLLRSIVVRVSCSIATIPVLTRFKQMQRESPVRLLKISFYPFPLEVA